MIPWVDNNSDDCSAVYDSAGVRGVGTSGVNLGGIAVKGGEPHHEPRVMVVSPTTGVNQSRASDPTRTFVAVEKAVHAKVNLERPIHLEEDPHAPRSAHQAYAPANYETKVKDPSGLGKLNKVAVIC